MLYRLTGGLVDAGESPRVLQRRELAARVAAPLSGSTRVIVVLTRGKGGIGKTTMSMLLGQTLAGGRTDRTAAIDVTPDQGTLRQRCRAGSRATVGDAAAAAADGPVDNVAELAGLVARDPSRLDVIGSDPDSEYELDATGYARLLGLLRRYYDLVVADAGTNLDYVAGIGLLDSADAAVVVSGVADDETTMAEATLTRLRQRGYPRLADSATVAVRLPPAGSSGSADLERYFAERAGAAVRIPWDRHLEAGQPITVDRMRPETRQAAVTMTAHVVDTLAR